MSVTSPELLRTDEVARRLRRSTRTVYRLRDEGRLRPIRLRGHGPLLWLADDVARLLDPGLATAEPAAVERSADERAAVVGRASDRGALDPPPDEEA